MEDMMILIVFPFSGGPEKRRRFLVPIQPETHSIRFIHNPTSTPFLVTF